MLPTTVSTAALRNGKESLKLLPTPPPNSNVFLGPSALPHFSNLGLIFLHFKSPVPRVVSSLCSGICIDATFTKWKDKISTGTSWKVISAASNLQPTARHTIFLANTSLDLCWMGDFPFHGEERWGSSQSTQMQAPPLMASPWKGAPPSTQQLFMSVQFPQSTQMPPALQRGRSFQAALPQGSFLSAISRCLWHSLRG